MKNLLFLSVLIFSLFSCEKGRKFENQEPMREDVSLSSSTNAETNSSEYQMAEEKILIKNGNIIIDSPLSKKNLQELKNLLKSLGAEISEETQTSQADHMEVDLVCRVPFQNFDKLIEKIDENFKIYSKNIETEDATKQYIDISARLKTKKDLENRYLQMLSKAQKVSDMIEIEKELAKIREEIEAAESQINYLKNQSQKSTLNIHLRDISSTNSTNRFFSAFKNGWEGFLDFLEIVINLWVFLLLIPLCYFLFKRFNPLKKKRNSLN